MSEDLKLQLAVLAKNTITLICFTILSVIFNHWWIVFFAIIFITTVEKEREEEKR